LERRAPIRSRTSFTESANEWSDSAISADEPVIAAAANLASATNTFAARAVITATPCSDDGVEGSGAFGVDMT